MKTRKDYYCYTDGTWISAEDHKFHKGCTLKEESKHTPTPWKAYQEKKDRYHISTEKELVALVFENEGRATGNAAFIVQAVNNHDELVKSLKLSIELLEGIKESRQGQNPTLDKELDWQIKNNKQAIAKAEGK